MATIKERILARRDLDALRLARDLDGLADGLNTEPVPTMLPSTVNADQILVYAPHSDVIYGLLQMAAQGTSVQALASQLLTEEGVAIMVPGYEPPYVTRYDVADAMFNDDGSEK